MNKKLGIGIITGLILAVAVVALIYREDFKPEADVEPEQEQEQEPVYNLHLKPMSK